MEENKMIDYNILKNNDVYPDEFLETLTGLQLELIFNDIVIDKQCITVSDIPYKVNKLDTETIKALIFSDISQNDNMVIIDKRNYDNSISFKTYDNFITYVKEYLSLNSRLSDIVASLNGFYNTSGQYYYEKLGIKDY